MSQRILIITAMESETKAICDALSLTKNSSNFGVPAPFVTYTGVLNHSNIMLAWSGKDPIHTVDNIGTQPVVLSTFLSIKEFRPDIVINIGTAGGFSSQGTKVNDIFVSKSPVVYHGRRIALQEFTNYGIGSYPAFPGASTIAKHLGIKEGIVSTGDSFDHDAKELEYIRSLGGNAIEMEAAAVAWVCSLFNIPFLAIKLIVNLVDGPEPAHEEFVKNFTIGCHYLSTLSRKLFEHIDSIVLQQAEPKSSP